MWRCFNFHMHDMKVFPNCVELVPKLISSHQSLSMLEVIHHYILQSNIRCIEVSRMKCMHGCSITIKYDGIILFYSTSLMLHSLETCSSHNIILNIFVLLSESPALQIMQHLIIDREICWENTVWEIAFVSFLTCRVDISMANALMDNSELKWYE